ncbi:MAG: hypothetical protein KJP22_10980 [Acidimicrobiia bacterium]|nr:hypothetical protein [Acidimicrobiia bacterium]MBT8193915.1 hypothetical protein [Acidimicrobiia bacterium]NNJ47813.1 hypothetical protein [Acidimicrobiia bacterium]
MTVGSNSARRTLVVLVVAMVPLLMAITINFPAQAGAPATEVDVELVPVAPPPQTEAPAVDLDVADEVTPTTTEGPDYRVILDTGVDVVGYESSISALALVAIPEMDAAEGLAESDVVGTSTGD